MSAFLPVIADPQLGQHQKAVLQLVFNITGAKAASVVGDTPRITFGFDDPATATSALGQTTVDRLIGANQVDCATAFGATAMGLNAFGFVLDCAGQIANASGIRAMLSAGTPVWAAGGAVTTLPNTLAASGRLAVTPNGNLAGQLVISGLDAATSGLLVVELFVELK